MKMENKIIRNYEVEKANHTAMLNYMYRNSYCSGNCGKCNHQIACPFPYRLDSWKRHHKDK